MASPLSPVTTPTADYSPTIPQGAVVDNGQGPKVNTSMGLIPQPGASGNALQSTGGIGPTPAQQGYGNPTGGGNYGPTVGNPYGWSTINGKVTPNPAPAAPATGGATGAASYAEGSNFTPPRSEEQIREDMLKNAQASIDAINQQFSATIAQDSQHAQDNQTNVNASASRMGLMGSPTGGSMLSSQAQRDDRVIAADRAQQAAAIAAIYDKVDSNALAQANLEKSQAVTDSATYVKNQQAIADSARATLADLAKNVNISTFGDIQTQEPDIYNKILSQLGGDPLLAESIFNSAKVAGSQVQYKSSHYDPITGDMVMVGIDPTKTGDAAFVERRFPANPNTTESGVLDLTHPMTDSQGTFFLPKNLRIESGKTVDDYKVRFQDGKVISGAPKWQKVGVDENGNAVYGYPTPSGGASSASGGSASSGGVSSADPATTATEIHTASASAENWFTAISKTASAVPPDPSWANDTIPEIGGRTANAVYQFALGVALKDDKVQASIGGLSNNTKTESGRQDIAYKRAITNMAGAIGAMAGGLPGLQMMYKNNAAAATKLFTQSVFIKTFTSTATDNLNLAMKQSPQVSTTDASAINGIFQKYQNNFAADPNLTKFEVYIYTAAREYAKVTSGGAMSAAGLTDSATKEAETLLNAAQSPGQFASAVQAMKDDMANVNKEFDKTYNDTMTSVQNLGTPNSVGSSVSDTSNLPDGTQVQGDDGQTYTITNGEPVVSQ